MDHLGYRVVARTSSLDALETFRSDPDRFDLVITDVTMPDMTGIQLSRGLLEIRPDLPVILCTGYSEMIDKKTIREIGVRGFFMKPIETGEMAAVIRRALDGNGELK